MLCPEKQTGLFRDFNVAVAPAKTWSTTLSTLCMSVLLLLATNCHLFPRVTQRGEPGHPGMAFSPIYMTKRALAKACSRAPRGSGGIPLAHHTPGSEQGRRLPLATTSLAGLAPRPSQMSRAVSFPAPSQQVDVLVTSSRFDLERVQGAQGQSQGLTSGSGCQARRRACRAIPAGTGAG